MAKRAARPPFPFRTPVAGIFINVKLITIVSFALTLI